MISSRARETSFFVLGLLCFTHLFLQAIFPEESAQRAKTQQVTGLEITSLDLQAKIFVGVMAYTGQPNGMSVDANRILREAQEQIRTQFVQSLSTETQPDTSPPLIRKKAIFSAMLGEKEYAEKFLVELAALENHLPEESELNQLVQKAIVENKAPQTEEDQALAKKKLGWWSGALQLLADRDSVQAAEFQQKNLAAFYSFMVVGVAFFVLVTVGVLGLIFFAILFTLGKTKLRGVSRRMPWAYGIEIFALYLLGMTLIEFVLPYFVESGQVVSILKGNAIAISALTLIVLWPVVNRISFSAVRESTGLTVGRFSQGVIDSFGAPVFYCCLMVLLFTVLIFYSMLLSALGVNPESGAHPIVPLLSSTRDRRILNLIILLAVVVAPVVEEIMFRGVFYGWLRSRLTVVPSMFICGFCFAAVHPQGLVGIVPLTVIGMLLCFLREWRGTLVAPILVHGMINGGTLLLVLTFFT